MKTLLLLRHAKSDWSDDDLSDHDRILNARGRHAAPRMGELIKRLDLVPDAILSSTAVRARTTAEAVAAAAGFASVPVLDPILYHATPGTIIGRLNGLGTGRHRRVMVVAHNPGLADLLARLTGHDDPFPTATLAQIDLPIATWMDLDGGTSGELVGIWRPRELD